MSYVFENLNPCKVLVGDCVIRAIAKVTGMEWESVYINLCEEGRYQCDIPSSNAVWGKFLLDLGFRKHTIPNEYPSCYTVEKFCRDNPHGRFVLATGSHAVASIDGNYYDIWDCGQETIAYFFEKGAI